MSVLQRIGSLKKVSRSAFFYFIFFSGVLFFYVAYTAQALTVSPVRMEVAVDPGQVYKGEYRLVNDTNSQRTYYGTFQNFYANGESGVPQFVDEEIGLAGWMRGPESITLEPQEARIVPFEIIVPEDAQPGGYFSAIFWMTQPVTAQNRNTIGFRIGILVLLRVNGDIEEKGGIISLETDRFITQTPQSFVYRFQNDGSDRLLPQGKLTVTNMFGRITTDFDANPQLGNILPGSRREFSLRWDGTDDAAPEKFFEKVAYQWRHFHMGSYTASLDLVYGQGDQLSDHQSVQFFIVPVQLLVVIFAAFMIVYINICIIRNVIRWSVRRQVLQAHNDRRSSRNDRERRS